MSFHAGQKVVCIKKGPWARAIDFEIETAPCPQFNGVYTVATVHHCYAFGDVIELVEFRTDADGRLPLWQADYFRPIVDRKTDISIFTDMLTPAPREKVDA